MGTSGKSGNTRTSQFKDLIILQQFHKAFQFGFGSRQFDDQAFRSHINNLCAEYAPPRLP